MDSSKSPKASNEKNGFREVRIFSEGLKKRIVTDIRNGLITVSASARLYEVGRGTIYKWLDKYSPTHHKGVRKVVEMESETYKFAELQKRLAETERAFGQKQLEVEYLNRLIASASEDLGVDLKKNFAAQASNGSGSTDRNTAGQ
jgi:transposase-like protein